MARADVLNILYSREKSPLEFKFDSLWAPPLLSLLPMNIIEQLRQIATSVKLSSKIKEKYAMIQKLLEPYGFRKFHAGTNRIIFKHLEQTDIVLKVALDDVGMKDNPKEFYNQQFLKPFVAKTYEVSPCGTVAISERLEPITSVLEFQSIAEDIFDLIVENIIGEYVLEDIGTKYFRNWGLRKGFGPALLDYPYMFKLDGNRLYCNNEDPYTHQICGGVIDYDAGFNRIICTDCGKEYLASDLKQDIQENKIELKNGELDNMKVCVKRGNEVIYRNEISETSTPKQNRFNSQTMKNTGKRCLKIRVNTSQYDSNNIVNVGKEVEQKPTRYDVRSNFMKHDKVEKKNVYKDEKKTVYKEEVVKPKEEEKVEPINIDPEVMAQKMMGGLGIDEEEVENYGKEEVEEKEEVVVEQPQDKKKIIMENF